MKTASELYKESAELMKKASASLSGDGEISEEKQTEIDSWVKNAKEIKARAIQLEEVMSLEVEARHNSESRKLDDESKSSRNNYEKLEYKKGEFHEFMVDIFRQGKGGRTSERLVNLQHRDMAGQSGAAGGFLLPAAHIPDILSARAEASISRSRAKIVPMTTRTLEYPALDHSGSTAGQSNFFGGVVVNWTEENSAITESQPTFKNVNLHARNLAGYVEVPNSLIADSPISLESFLSGPGSFGGALGWTEDYSFLQGDGVGKPLGVLNSPAKVSVTRNTSTDFKFVDAVTMKSKLLIASSKPVWIINQSVMPKLYQFQGGNSENIFIINGADGAPESLLGHPIIWTEKTPALGTAGDVMLIDFSMYLIGDRDRLTMDVSTEHKFQNNQTAFRISQDVDGQPWLGSSITLADGATTVSPFVTLS